MTTSWSRAWPSWAPRPARRGWCTVLVLLALVAPAAAEDEAPSPRVQAADAALRSYRSGDSEALKQLAARDDPDPWLVADVLVARGHLQAAMSFARAAPRGDTKDLPAYLSGLQGVPLDARVMEAAAEADTAVEDREYEEGLRLAEDVSPPDGTATQLRLLRSRGVALRSLRRLVESEEILGKVTEAASKLGWHAEAARSTLHAGHTALRSRDPGAALTLYRKALQLHEARQDRVGVATALTWIGTAHIDLRQFSQAREHLERSRELFRGLQYQRGEIALLGNLGNLYLYLHLGERARECFERCLVLIGADGDKSNFAAVHHGLGTAHILLRNYEQATLVCARAAQLSEELGNRGDQAKALVMLGRAHLEAGDSAAALACFQQASKLSEELGATDVMALTLHAIGAACVERNELPEAAAHLEQALELRSQGQDPLGIAKTLGLLGSVYEKLGDYRRARKRLERAVTLLERMGIEEQADDSLQLLGALHWQWGSLARARACYERAAALAERRGDLHALADALKAIGGVDLSMGKFPSAIAQAERALRLFERIGNREGIALALGVLGGIRQSMGDVERARRCYEKTLTLSREADNHSVVALTRIRLGQLCAQQEDWEGALAHYRSVLAECEKRGFEDLRAQALTAMGRAHVVRGEEPSAIECFLGAIESYEKRRAPLDAAWVRHALGVALARLGRLDEARAQLDKALRDARRLRAPTLGAEVLTSLAECALETDEPAQGLLLARSALDEVEGILAGLAEEEGASLRSRFAPVFEVGALAAARADAPAELTTFLESGRAGSLLDAVGGRQALRWTDLPEELRAAETEAKAAEGRARHLYERALADGDRRLIRRRAAELDDALDLMREAHARIQRDAKKQAQLQYPKATTLEDIQDWLEEGQALVLYGLCLNEAMALVITPGAERIVDLGGRRRIEEAASQVRVGPGHTRTRGPMAAEGASDEGVDGESVLSHLRVLLVDPLELPDEVSTVLVSPEGPLCYVPFGALYEGRNVVLTPSGTTHVLLMEEERDPGEGVLALGDPAYGTKVDAGAAQVYRGGAKLTALPATRDEALAIGDVTLLGDDATEVKLREAIAKQDRWRAVHLACHGLVDPDRPTLSSLALARAGEEDGFLTALEVLRMEIPADLAVLSACETAKGKVVKGEGIVGLTRAFMYAGSPRVLCSLWKVDDDATRALMERFYELWNPKEGEGLGAAEALHKAQAHIRSQEKWAHPYYWAAWVLWGLP